MTMPDFTGDLLAAVRALPALAGPSAGPDPDDVHRVLEQLADEHAPLEVWPADWNGSVRVEARDTGRRWRVTRDGRVVTG
jgi:hypothetical protein